MNVTITAKEEEVWKWKAAAVSERKRFGEWVRSRLNADGTGRQAVKAAIQKAKEEEKPKGVEVEFKESGEVVKVVNQGNVEAELARLKAANKAMVGRYGK